MEKVDAYDESGKKIGRAALKRHAHQQGVWHRTIHVWIINSSGELLIQRRAPQKEANPNKWGVASVGGHISAGDDSVTTAIRETKEELGLSLQRSGLEFLFTTPHQQILNNGNYLGNHLDDCFLVQKDIKISKLELQSEEVSEVRLIHFTELEKQIITKHLEFAQHPEYKKLFPILHSRYAR